MSPNSPDMLQSRWQNIRLTNEEKEQLAFVYIYKPKEICPVELGRHFRQFRRSKLKASSLDQTLDSGRTLIEDSTLITMLEDDVDSFDPDRYVSYMTQKVPGHDRTETVYFKIQPNHSRVRELSHIYLNKAAPALYRRLCIEATTLDKKEPDRDVLSKHLVDFFPEQHSRHALEMFAHSLFLKTEKRKRSQLINSEFKSRLRIDRHLKELKALASTSA